ncbi:MAG: hypothetical protein LM590_12615 [Thermofilum sp.]|nr:hypothetical protein [Thermofilum sp.]
MEGAVSVGMRFSRRVAGGCECDVTLNDYEHVRLFDGVLFEHHAYAADPRAPKALQLFRKGFGG